MYLSQSPSPQEFDARLVLSDGHYRGIAFHGSPYFIKQTIDHLYVK